ncbi:type II toxin-antitoxin system Phd/YefM family antitoxin [Rhizobium hidalgonense]|uniref:type II toxin-antitoxin system Phd/YefM family antitoxin n=1 Tax=Rhizobium hidalgonense TaxID=1538159 RepID=UPI002870DE0B|nr:antitoxin of toxin-antitoxin stability system [Rhizobium hidalgonense]MDR9808220.1 antitoxin of toxin-antitoxin stability system [Rhizobium hidalgonense]
MPEPREPKSSPRRVGVQEFATNLTSFLKQVEDGHRFVLMEHHRAIAEISPPSADIAVRKPGALRGKIRTSDDFDFLPADVLKAMEHGE